MCRSRRAIVQGCGEGVQEGVEDVGKDEVAARVEVVRKRVPVLWVEGDHAADQSLRRTTHGYGEGISFVL